MLDQVHLSGQQPDGYVEVAVSKVDGDLDAAASRLKAEQVPISVELTTYLPKSNEAQHVYRIFAAPERAADAKEIIELVQAGAFELRDDEDPDK